MVGQAVARHLRLPGIIVLLLLGVLLGPDVANFVQPSTLGAALHLLVGFAVAVILFEGGLNLEIARLRRQQRAIQQLVTLGALVTAIGGTLAGRLLMGWPWRIAVLFGTLVVVTGPTVITPLLRRLKVQRQVSTILEAEGLLIDAIGAVLAAFAVEIAIEPSGASFARALADSGLRIGVGVGVGTVGGLILVLLLRRRRWVPEGLENTFVLSVAWAIFICSNAFVHESGVAAVTIAGLVVGNGKTRVHHGLQEFKEQLTVMLIGLLFVLLAADVRLSEIQALGARGIWVVVVLMIIVRPLNAWIGTWRCGLNWRQRAFIGWIGPRGIIAAAIASLFAADLAGRGVSSATELRALVFLVIAATVVIGGLSGGLVARLLKLKQRQSGWVVLGANALARTLALALRESADDVVLIDTNEELCQTAEAQGLQAICENALGERAIEASRVETRLGAIGLSLNEEINILFLQLVRSESQLRSLFVALQPGGISTKMAHQAGAEVLFSAVADLGLWAVRCRLNSARTERFILPKGGKVADLESLIAEGLVLPLVHYRGKERWPVTDAVTLRSGDQLAVLVLLARQAEALAALEQLGWQLEQGEQPAVARS
ncbi:MAG: sodium:proton antiporter [Deltaproteobacteria bacterium]|nr:sodium:proton antiporter [Deltaproteobacteria bacterium]